MDNPEDPCSFPPGDPPGEDRPDPAGAPSICPECGQHYGPETLFCVSCGIHLLTGERIAREGADEPAEEPALDPLWARALGLVPGLFSARVLVYSGISLTLALVCAVLCLFFAGIGAIMIAASAGAAGMILYAQAVAMILTGEVQLLSTALADFDGTRWSAFFFAVAVPFSGVLTLILMHAPKAG